MQTSLTPSQSRSPEVKEWTVEPGTVDLHTQSIQSAIDDCARQGGGRVVLRAGRYVSGTIRLRSRVILHLEKDAIVTGSANMLHYARKDSCTPGARLLGGESTTALLLAENAEHIGITGEGVLDGNGEAFWKKKSPAALAGWIEDKKKVGEWVPGFETGLRGTERPRALILFSECRDVFIELAHIESSPAWTIHLLACTSVTLRGIRLRGALHGANTDGIDLDGCSDVLVEDCDIFTGDDAIALKNTGAWGLDRPSRNITVRRCRLRSTTHGFTIGTETRKNFEKIVLEDCRIEPAGEYGTKTGIGLSILDGAAIKGVRITNVSMEGAVAPIQIRLGNAGRGQKLPLPGSISDLILERISIRGASGNCLLAGLPGHPLKNITLRNIHLEFIGGGDPARNMSTLPEMADEYPPNGSWRHLPAYGFFCRNIDGLTFSDVSCVTKTKDLRPAFWLKNISAFVGTNIQASEPVPEGL